MLDEFSAHFAPDPPTGGPPEPWRSSTLLAATGYAELVGRFAGRSFENGLYRLHDAHTGPPGVNLIDEAFPNFKGRATAFGVDWLGRQLAVDGLRIVGNEPQVLLMSPGSGEALEIPLTFAQFHQELFDLREPALEATLFHVWARSHPEEIPVARSRCVGYRVPLFLGGQHAIDNLEVVDFDVYWTLCGQLREGIRSLPSGTTIGSISVKR